MTAPALPSIACQLAEFHAAAARLEAAALPIAATPQRTAQAGSARERLLAALAASPGKWLSMATIRSRVGADICPKTIRAYVSDMHGDRQILRMGEPGRYRYRMPAAAKR